MPETYLLQETVTHSIHPYHRTGNLQERQAFTVLSFTTGNGYRTCFEIPLGIYLLRQVSTWKLMQAYTTLARELQGLNNRCILPADLDYADALVRELKNRGRVLPPLWRR